MKKLLFSLCLLLAVGVVSNQAQAQTNFGIRGGINFANFNDTDAETESLTGFHAGVYTSFHIPNSPVYIQPEVLYTRKGAEIDQVVSDQNVTVKAKLDYIEVPVLARFDFITDGNITPHVYFGPYLGINVSAESEVTEGESSFESDIEDNVKSTDFGVMVGGGLDFGRFNLGVRYGAGLTEVFDEGGDGAKNGVLSVTAGIGF